jgi:hypothetical protein
MSEPHQFIRLSLCFAVSAALVATSIRGQSASGITWRPLIGIEESSGDAGQIFPAAVLSLASLSQQSQPANVIGNRLGMLGVSIVGNVPGTRVRVTARVDGLAQESGIDAVLADAQKEYRVWPTIRWDTRALLWLHEPRPATVAFSVSVDGKPIGDATRAIQVRVINDVPFGFRGADGRTVDLSVLFAAFVDENNPSIDGLLHDALAAKAVVSFTGYQGTPQEVTRQVFGIWNVLQRRRVRYSSITQPSGVSSMIMSQHVRFLDETLQNEEANCVDGTVLFASVLYKLGIYPELVITPEHMFLGFYLDAQRRQVQFLETTMIGNPPLGALSMRTFLTANGYVASESYRLFGAAQRVGQDEYARALPGLRASTPGYFVVDIDRARHAGIAAVPRS